MSEQYKNYIEMWPIKGLSKSKRLKWGDVQNDLSWTFMKMLREGNDTVKVYDINPYVEVYKFGSNMYGLWNPSLGGGGDVWQYLVIGPQKAMLIDTAFGLGNQKGLVDEITGGMPLIVVNTHLGGDHSLGNVHYERVYCHEYEVDNIKSRVKPGAFDNFNNDYLEYDLKDLPEYRDYELIGVPDGHIFNLGGDYNIELFWTAGHAAGHAMFIDKQGRYLFAGDDVISDRIGIGGPSKGLFYNEYRNLSAYRDRLAILVTRVSEFDQVYSGHFMSNMEPRVLFSILESLNKVIADPSDYDYIEETVDRETGRKSVGMYKFVKGLGRIRYNENSVYPPKA